MAWSCETPASCSEPTDADRNWVIALSNDSAVVTERRPDTVRGADVCFYSHARWPRASKVGNKLPPVPPDLAVEVVSPGNRIAGIMKKVAEYLEVGVSLVWVVYPKTRRRS